MSNVIPLLFTVQIKYTLCEMVHKSRALSYITLSMKRIEKKAINFYNKASNSNSACVIHQWFNARLAFMMYLLYNMDLNATYKEERRNK